MELEVPIFYDSSEEHSTDGNSSFRPESAKMERKETNNNHAESHFPPVVVNASDKHFMESVAIDMQNMTMVDRLKFKSEVIHLLQKYLVDKQS